MKNDKSKKVKNIKSLKTKLKKALPNHILKVIESYEEFLEQVAPEDAKGFSAHHSAGKSAVVHMETLLKLAKWTEAEAPSFCSEREENIFDLMEEARKKAYEFDDDDDDDENEDED